MPWISVNDENGYYLRKLLDRVTPTDPVMVRMVVEGRNHPPAELQTGNVYGILPGKSGKYIMMFTHVVVISMGYTIMALPLPLTWH